MSTREPRVAGALITCSILWCTGCFRSHGEVVAGSDSGVEADARAGESRWRGDGPCRVRTIAESFIGGHGEYFEETRPMVVDGRPLARLLGRTDRLPRLRALAEFGSDEGERLEDLGFDDAGLMPAFALPFGPARLLIGASLEDETGVELQVMDVDGRPHSEVAEFPFAGGRVPTSRTLFLIPTEVGQVFSFIGEAGREFVLLASDLTSASRLEPTGELPPSTGICGPVVASSAGNPSALVCGSGADTADGRVELQVHRGVVDLAAGEVRFERLRTSTQFEYPTGTRPVLVDNGSQQLVIMNGRFRDDVPSSCFVLLLEVAEDGALTEPRRLYTSPCVYDPEVWFSAADAVRIAGRWSVDWWDGPVVGRMETLTLPELESAAVGTYPLHPASSTDAIGYEHDGAAYLFSNSSGTPNWPLELVRCEL